MKQFKKILLSMLILAFLFIENANAACNIKLHVRVPSGTSDWSNFYVVFGTGTSDAIPDNDDRLASGATADAETGADWYVVNLNGLNPDTPNQGFLILRTNNGNSKIGRDYNVTAATNFLACPAGADGEDYYLYEDPANPGRSLLSTEPPSDDPDPGGPIIVPGTARTFYFLPPNDPEWISSTPYFWLRSNPTPLKMSIDPDHCGWYKIEFSASIIPSGDAFILRSSSDFTGNSTYRIGLLGMAEGPSDWECNSQRSCFPTPFDLSKQFSEISSPAGSRNLFFVADAGEWHATDPGMNERERCSYNFAAIIYDTDRNVNCSFNPNNNTAGWSSAVKKGIVQPTLDANRKLQFNTSAATERCSRTNESSNASCVYSSANDAPNNCIAGWNAQNFNKVWDAKDPSNVVRCYDMPFERSKAGLWEFNSNQLCARNNVMDLNGNCTGNGGYLGGFFPNELQTRGDAADLYASDCPDCDARYSATGWQGLANNVNPWCYERGWSGTGRNTGDLSSAQTTAEINAVMTGAGCTGEFPDTTRWAGLYGGTNNGSPGQRNFFFCFESHANFTYERGQEFFFSGDDDVWIFINNRLVLDLGGVHSAVPGYVKLDTIKTPARLEEGKEYPIDIFFCERNLQQSNIRITTNMYFSQQSGMFLATKDAEIVGDVCLMRSGTGNSCADMATGGNRLDTLCGTQIKENLRYYIANRAGTAGTPLPTNWSVPGDPNGIVLDESNDFCEAKTDNIGPYLLCYGGIKIYRELGKVQVLDDEVVGLVGTWRVWAAYVGTISPKPPPMRVAEFTKNAKVRVVWGKLVHSVNNSSVGNLPNAQSDTTVAGKPVKVGFAVATETSPGTFVVAMEEGGSPGTQFNLAGSSFSGTSLEGVALPRANLRVFADSLGQEEYDKNKIFVIPPSGYLELWFTGSFGAGDDARYSINASGSTSSPSYVLDVYQTHLEAGLFLQSAKTGKEICLQEAASAWPICGAELSSRISYSLMVPEVGSVPLDSEASDCVWFTATQGLCYSGIVLNNGVVSINEDAIPDYLKILGFELYASVSGYTPLSVSRTEAVVSIAKILPIFRTQEPAYYNLKGEPLGKQKPKRAGVYIVRQNGVNRVEVVVR